MCPPPRRERDRAPKVQPPRNLSGPRTTTGEATLEHDGDSGGPSHPDRPGALMPLPSPATTFADRHLGPRPEDVERMLAALGVATLDELIDQAVPKTIRTDQPLTLPDARSEPEVLAVLRALADRNRVVTSLIGTGYSRHPHAGRDPAQRAGGPGLVHRLHALPARDQPGPPGGAAQLPDHGDRPHRHGDRQRLHARRVDRRRRGHDPAPALDQAHRGGVLRRRRDPSADDRRRRRPRRADRDRAGRRLARRARPRPRCSAPSSSTRAPPAWCATWRPPSTPSTPPAGWWRWPPTCSPAPSSRRPASRAPTCASAPRSASGCRSATADPTPGSWRRGTGCGGRCRGGWSASPSMPPGAPPTASPSRPASSTSAGRRRRPTSAPPRCSWP